jgi:nucleoside-diphosphate-sugar epimerase
MKILVTGATGFTGSHLARALLKSGNTVRALVHPRTSLPEVLVPLVEQFTGDLVSPDDCLRAVEGCSTVYHIAAVYREEVSRQIFFDVNAGGTRNILEACEKHGVERIVHCSTVGVHGHLKSVPGDENAPIAPGDPYQESKLEGERIAQSFARDRGLPVSIFRPTGIYGPGDTRLLKFFRMVKKRRPLIGSGKPHYHLTYIDDLVEGIILCGAHPAAVGETFILAGPEAPTLREWYDAVAGILDVKPLKLRLPVWPFIAAGAVFELLFKPLGMKPPIHRRSVHFFTHDRWFDTSKAASTIGFEPKIGLREGMKRTAEWYESQGLI